MKDRPIDRILGPHISTPGSCQFIYIYNWCPLFPSSMFFSIYLFLFLIPFPSPIPFLPLPVPFPLSILTLFLLVFWSFSSLSSFFSCFLFLSLSLSERVIRSIVFGGVSFLLLHGTSCISIVCLFPFLALFNCFPVLLNILSMCLGSDPYSIYVSALTYFFEKWHIISTHTL